jgi:hypothetical protein
MTSSGMFTMHTCTHSTLLLTYKKIYYDKLVFTRLVNTFVETGVLDGPYINAKQLFTAKSIRGRK